MLTMILEETEGGTTQNDPKDATDSMSGMQMQKEENLTFPRRSRCPKTSARKIDWVQLLAKATEEDKKANIELTYPLDGSDSDNDGENQTPIGIDLSKATPKRTGEDAVLDLSSMARSVEARSARKGYTMPTYEPQYKAQAPVMRPTPLRELNSATKPQGTRSLFHPRIGRGDVVAKKALFHSNEIIYEREVISHKHISIQPANPYEPQRKEVVEPITYSQSMGPRTVERCEPPREYRHEAAPKVERCEPPREYRHEAAPKVERCEPPREYRHEAAPKVERYEGTREYGHSNSSGFYSQTYACRSPPHPVRDDIQHSPEIHVEPPHQERVFAVPEPPQRFKPSTKEIVVNGKPYQTLALLGKGGSSKVYLVLAKDNSLLAIKCVNLGNVDEKTKMDYRNEIDHLIKMQSCKHIIKIIDHQYVPARNLLYAVMERGDTDLSRLLKERTTSGEGVPPEMILFYWSEILLAVKSIHDNNIIHRDLKPANFLLVAGRLKLIDFGIASAIQSEQTSVFKDSQSGTPNYMSPEAWEDLGVGDQRVVRIGRKTDVWSLGCILYTFLYGKTPFQEFNNPMAKFRAITNPNHTIRFPKVKGVPDMLIDSCRQCLIYDKDKRASIDQLLRLKSQILMTPPEVLDKLRPVLNDEAFEKAKAVVLSQDESSKT